MLISVLSMNRTVV